MRYSVGIPRVVADSPATVVDLGRGRLESLVSEFALDIETAGQTADCTGIDCVAVEGNLEGTGVQIEETVDDDHTGLAEIPEAGSLAVRRAA